MMNWMLISCAFFLTSCGKSDPQNKLRPQMAQEQESLLDDQGHYRAVLRPLNSIAGGNSLGRVEVRIKADDMVIESHMIGTAPDVKHFQHIMSGGECPTEKDDANADGLIDFREALSKTKKILIPLDSDISDQFTGYDFGPIANSVGGYVYRRSTSLSKVLADLHAPDPDPLDDLVKLSEGQDIKLQGRVVLIFGTATDEYHPIACGEMVRLDEDF